MLKAHHDPECDERHHQGEEQSKPEGATDHHEKGAPAGRPSPAEQRPAVKPRAPFCNKAVGRDRTVNLLDWRGGLYACDAP
jgi:hypothetical protein